MKTYCIVSPPVSWSPLASARTYLLPHRRPPHTVGTMHTRRGRVCVRLYLPAGVAAPAAAVATGCASVVVCSCSCGHSPQASGVNVRNDVYWFRSARRLPVAPIHRTQSKLPPGKWGLLHAYTRACICYRQTRTVAAAFIETNVRGANTPARHVDRATTHARTRTHRGRWWVGGWASGVWHSRVGTGGSAGKAAQKSAPLMRVVKNARAACGWFMGTCRDHTHPHIHT